MWIALGIIAAILLAAIIYLASLDGNYRVKRSLEIDAAADSVFAAIVDLKSWPEWSPWLMHEPETDLVYSDNFDRESGYYEWNGRVVGAGKVTHLRLNPPRSIHQQIEFIKPFKASCPIEWSFEARGDKTLVSWQMTGRMPFLFRFMTKTMEPMIGRDYDLGLALLNGYMNKDAAHPRITFIGEQTLEDFSYWAIPSNGNLRQLETNRQTSIDALEAAADGKAGMALTLYHDFDAMANQFQAEVAVPISDAIPQSNYTRREFSGGRYFQANLHGDHLFLPLAWYALHSHCRMHKIKQDKSRPALEIYHDDPRRLDDSNQLCTALYLPIK